MWWIWRQLEIWFYNASEYCGMRAVQAAAKNRYGKDIIFGYSEDHWRRALKRIRLIELVQKDKA